MSRRLACGRCLLAVLAIAPWSARAAEPGVKPGVLWEETMEMGPMRGFQMPPQTRQACRPAQPDDWSGPPSGKDDCKVTSLERSRSKMSWKVVCEKDRITGDGDMTFTADTYAGTINMHSADGDFSTKIRGRRIGTPCDAGEDQRRVEQIKRQASEAQAAAARGQEQMCEGAVQNLDFNLLNFETCRPRKAEACARMDTLAGWQLVTSRPESMRTQAEQACGKDLAAIQQRLCGRAPGLLRRDVGPNDRDNSQTFAFISKSCPPQRQALAQAECAGRSYTGKNAPAAWVQGFCGQYAQAELQRGSQRPAPIEAAEKKPEKPASAKDDAVDAAKKAAKGIFGF